MQAYRHRDSLRDTGALTPWLYRIASHVYLDRVRQQARRTPVAGYVDLDPVECADRDAPSVEQTAEQNEMGLCVQGYLAGLPDSSRMVVLLRPEQGLTTPEIAEILGISGRREDSPPPGPPTAGVVGKRMHVFARCTRGACVRI